MGLSRAISRNPFELTTKANAHVSNGAGYVQQGIDFLNGRLHLDGGLRIDYFRFGLRDWMDPVLGGAKDAPIVLYCNGPHCGKSKRLAAELVAAAYRNVRRYQLGIPVWRALGGVCEIEAGGLRHVLGHDQTAVVIDARPAASFAAGSLPRARNIPRELVLPGKDIGEVRRAKDDGRLPMEDHNTRIVVVGRDAQEARYVAEALAREAFHNVSYFPGTFDALPAAAK